MYVISFSGLPGAGKSVAAEVATALDIPVLRLGDLTDDELKKRGQELTEANEKPLREELRVKEGMDVYARRVSEKADALGVGAVILDGVRSYAEYQFLKEKYKENFVAISILSAPSTRYARLGQRAVRALTPGECVSRDEAELKNLDHGSTVAMGDYYVVNEDITEAELKERVRALVQELTTAQKQTN